MYVYHEFLVWLVTKPRFSLTNILFSAPADTHAPLTAPPRDGEFLLNMTSCSMIITFFGYFKYTQEVPC